MIEHHILKKWRLSEVVTQRDPEGQAQIGSEKGPILAADQDGGIHDAAP
jgi:hypothetical protein